MCQRFRNALATLLRDTESSVCERSIPDRKIQHSGKPKGIATFWGFFGGETGEILGTSAVAKLLTMLGPYMTHKKYNLEDSKQDAPHHKRRWTSRRTAWQGKSLHLKGSAYLKSGAGFDWVFEWRSSNRDGQKKYKGFARWNALAGVHEKKYVFGQHFAEKSTLDLGWGVIIVGYTFVGVKLLGPSHKCWNFKFNKKFQMFWKTFSRKCWGASGQKHRLRHHFRESAPLFADAFETAAKTKSHAKGTGHTPRVSRLPRRELGAYWVWIFTLEEGEEYTWCYLDYVKSLENVRKTIQAKDPQYKEFWKKHFDQHNKKAKSKLKRTFRVADGFWRPVQKVLQWIQRKMLLTSSVVTISHGVQKPKNL